MCCLHIQLNPHLMLRHKLHLQLGSKHIRKQPSAKNLVTDPPSPDSVQRFATNFLAKAKTKQSIYPLETRSLLCRRFDWHLDGLGSLENFAARRHSLITSVDLARCAVERISGSDHAMMVLQYGLRLHVQARASGKRLDATLSALQRDMCRGQRNAHAFGVLCALAAISSIRGQPSAQQINPKISLTVNSTALSQSGEVFEVRLLCW